MRHLNTRREQLRDALLCAEEALKEGNHAERMTYLTIARDAALGIAKELDALMKRLT